MAEVSLVKLVMAWCHQATSHYLSQCSRSLAPYGITRPQCVKAYSRASEKNFSFSAKYEAQNVFFSFIHSFQNFSFSAPRSAHSIFRRPGLQHNCICSLHCSYKSIKPKKMYCASMTQVHLANAPSQWEMTLHCNVASHWLGAYTKWSLKTTFISCDYVLYMYHECTLWCRSSCSNSFAAILCCNFCNYIATWSPFY